MALKRRRRAPPIVPLNNKDLAAEQLLENLLKRAHIPKRPQRPGIQEESTLITANDRGHEERTLVTSQLARSGDGGSLANVEDVNRSSP